MLTIVAKLVGETTSFTQIDPPHGWQMADWLKMSAMRSTHCRQYSKLCAALAAILTSTCLPHRAVALFRLCNSLYKHANFNVLKIGFTCVIYQSAMLLLT